MKYLEYLLVAAFLISGVLVYADETDSLIDTLMGKGVITSDEAKMLKTTPSSTSGWAQNLSFSGDFRNRFQDDLMYDAATLKSYYHRDRDEIRLRLGADTKVVDNVKVGFGIATSNTPRSRSATLGGDFATPALALDYGYIEYSPISLVTLDIGKMKTNPIWNTSDIYWDPDLTYDGIALKLKKNISDKITATTNGGIYILDENKINNITKLNGTGSKEEYKYPSMYFVQPTVSYKVNDNIALKAGVAYFYTMNIASQPMLTQSLGANTMANGCYAYSYNDLNPSLEITLSKLLDVLPYIDLSGDQARNPDPSKYNNSYSGTFKVGNTATIDSFGKWQLAYIHKYLEKDAWLDVFTDDNTYSGKTNTVGSKTKLDFGLTKSTTLTLSYYKYDCIIGKTTHTGTELTQVDMLVKF